MAEGGAGGGPGTKSTHQPSAGAENEWEPDPEVLVLVLQHAAEAPLGTALTGRLQQPAYDRNLLQPA